MQAIRVLSMTLAVVVASWAQGQINGLGELPRFAESDQRADRTTQGVTQPRADTAVPAPKLTRQPDFFIPFQVSRQEREQPSEVRLYLSSDHGTNWTMYQRQPVTAQKFQFSAQTDGEYWFAVRTANAQGQLIAHRGWAPELVVVVDTQRPTLDLKASIDNYGDVQAEWTAEDANLAADTFRLQYQDTRGGPWKDVKARTPDEADARQIWNASADWWLQPNGDEILVRAEISDKAGNSTFAEKPLQFSRTAQGASSSAQFANGPPTNADTGPIRADEPAWNNTPSRLREQTPPWLSGGIAALPGPAPVTSKIAPPVANRFSPPATEQPSVPSGVSRITSSPTFELDYDLLDVGPRGARAVDLWYTTDQGRTWAKYGPDRDAKSPAEVRLDREGLYGFTLVVHGFDSPAPRPPQDGEPADFSIAVDWTKPVGRITGTRFGTDSNKNTLLIEWQAEDALLSERPIRLSYRTSPQESWKQITADLPNTEPYFQWRIPEPVPPRIYLQLEVRDMAGNVTTDQPAQPVSRQGGVPKARIRQLREMSTPRQSAFRPWQTR